MLLDWGVDLSLPIEEETIELVVDFLTEFGSATRQEVDQLLWEKLSQALTDQQKANRIRNLLNKMRESGQIENIGGRKNPKWVRLLKEP